MARARDTGEQRAGGAPRLRDEALLRAGVELVKRELLAGVSSLGWLDVALIGNASGLYPWEPAPVVDLDACVFVDAIGPSAGRGFSLVRDRLRTALAESGIEFELRIVRGAYKCTHGTAERPVIVAHLGVFTERSYATESPFLRWGWRKYPSVVEPDRLSRLAGPQPTLQQLLDGPRGVVARLKALEAGRAVMHEWCLPDLVEREWAVCATEPLFAESCFSAGATIARNHGRALGKPEADALPNREYFSFYQTSVLRSLALERLMALKQRARELGYCDALPEARLHAVAYLSQLTATLA